MDRASLSRLLAPASAVLLLAACASAPKSVEAPRPAPPSVPAAPAVPAPPGAAAAPARRVRVLVVDRATGSTHEAVADLDAGAVVTCDARDGLHAPILGAEFEEGQALKHHPDVKFRLGIDHESLKKVKLLAAMRTKAAKIARRPPRHAHCAMSRW